MKVNDGYVFGFVCLMDALGTKGAWRHHHPAEFVAKLQKLKKDFDEATAEGMAAVSGKAQPGILDFRFFQDTVFITYRFPDVEPGGKKKTPGPLLRFPMFSNMVAGPFNMALADGLYFRGAISQGWFYWSENILVGPAIDDAAEYFETADWMGLMCTPAASYAARYAVAHPRFTERSIDHSFVAYDVPFRESDSMRLEAINWPKAFRAAHKESNEQGGDRELLLRLLSDPVIPKGVWCKFENTVAFYDACTGRSAA